MIVEVGDRHLWTRVQFPASPPCLFPRFLIREPLYFALNRCSFDLYEGWLGRADVAAASDFS